MHAAALQTKLSAAARFALTATLMALLVVAGWTPARALPTLDVAGLQFGAGQTEGFGLDRRDGAAGNWRVRAPGASQLAARPGPADQDLDSALPGPIFTAAFAPLPAGHTTSALPRTGRLPAARRARAPPATA